MTDPAEILRAEINRSQNFYMLKLTDFKFDKQIGAGASAEVYKGMYKEMDVAIKRLRFPQDTMNAEAATLTREF